MANWYRHRVERRVVESSHATLCVSGTLCNKMQAMVPAARVVLSPNAVDSALLEQEWPERRPAHPPVIGYFGHLSPAWFDWPALIRVARRLPDHQFEIIGHSAPGELKLPPNVVLCGPRPWEELGRAAASWSAAIIPFRMGALADGVDPIKVYEYLAFGLPVVSFRMPQIEGYPAVTTVDSAEAFAKALREACQSLPDSGAIESFLERNTWERRIGQLLELEREARQ